MFNGHFIDFVRAVIRWSFLIPVIVSIFNFICGMVRYMCNRKLIDKIYAERIRSS